MLPGEKSFVRTYCILLCLPVTMLLLISVARETLHWITGSVNYLLPTLLAVSAFSLHYGAIREGKVRWYSLVLCFRFGSPTEQGGATAVVLTLFLSISETILKRRDGRNGLYGWIFPICTLAGYLTVLFAPGTFLRASYEGSIQTGIIIQAFFALFECMMGKEGIVPYFIVLFVLIAGMVLQDRPLPRFLVCGFGIAAALSVFYFMPFSSSVLSAAFFCIFLIFSVLTAVCFIKNEAYRGIGCFLFAAAVVQAVLIEASSTYARTMLPPVLLLTVCNAALAARLASRCANSVLFKNFVIGVLAFVVGIISFVPTLLELQVNRTGKTVFSSKYVDKKRKM